MASYQTTWLPPQQRSKREQPACLSCNGRKVKCVMTKSGECTICIHRGWKCERRPQRRHGRVFRTPWVGMNGTTEPTPQMHQQHQHQHQQHAHPPMACQLTWEQPYQIPTSSSSQPPPPPPLLMPPSLAAPRSLDPTPVFTQVNAAGAGEANLMLVTHPVEIPAAQMLYATHGLLHMAGSMLVHTHVPPAQAYAQLPFASAPRELPSFTVACTHVHYAMPPLHCETRVHPLLHPHPIPQHPMPFSTATPQPFPMATPLPLPTATPLPIAPCTPAHAG